MAAANHFALKDPPSEPISGIAYAPGSATQLLVASWDRNVYLYDTHAEPNGQLVRKFEHRAPVLDVCYGDNADEAFTVGLDWDVRRINLKTGEQTVLSTHEQPSNKVVFHAPTKLLISCGWDNTLHLHHPYATDPPLSPATVPLPAKPLALSLSPTRLVVGMSDRKLWIYDVQALSTLSAQSNEDPPNIVPIEPFQQRDSPLKFLTRAVAAMHDDTGYACSSIEGRVAVEWFDASKEAQAKNYAFKTHRLTVNDADTGEEVDEVYPVHAVAFHPVHGTFITCGGDGVINSWDTFAKRRIRGYQRYDAAVIDVAFSDDGSKLAVAVSPGFVDGDDGDDDPSKVQVWIRELADAELKPRGK